MGSSLVLPVRAVQLVLSFIVLILSGYVANWYNADTLTSSPSQLNFLVFASLWSLVSVGYIEGASRFVPRASHPHVALAMELTNVIFWFAGFIALGVFLSHLLFCRGTVCGAAQADTVFSAFLFVAWVVSVVLMGKNVLKAGFPKPSTAGTASSQEVGTQMKESAV